MELVRSDTTPNFGYVMPLRESRFIGIMDMMTGRADPSFHALATAGFELANSYYQLHARGLCYRDIAFGNVFFDPSTGEVRICDNDNVDEDGKPGAIGGTPAFMAPEIVQGKELPSTQTDLFSLAVLLFYIFHIHHPLQGKKMMHIHSWDLLARRKILGDEAIFIFDPHNNANEALPRSVDSTGEAGDNALNYWPIYPQFLRDLFTKAFTKGMYDAHNRIRETVWRAEMIRLRDAIVYCPHCATQNFYDADSIKVSEGVGRKCWHCKRRIQFPLHICIGKKLVMLNYNTQLYPHHIDDSRPYEFSAPVAAVAQHPANPSVWGLKNLSSHPWTATLPDGTIKVIEPGRSHSLSPGVKLNFGTSEGEIRA
jgi:eukaryotic-like serine/threonine-protein kinase